MRVNAWRVCRVRAGRRRGQDVCVSRVLQAAGGPSAAQAAHAAAALAACKRPLEMQGNVTLLHRHVEPSLCSEQTTSSHLPAVCGEPRCPRWCCSAAPEWENPEDSALPSVTLAHTDTQSRHCLLLHKVLIYLSFIFFY